MHDSKVVGVKAKSGKRPEICSRGKFIRSPQLLCYVLIPTNWPAKLQLHLWIGNRVLHRPVGTTPCVGALTSVREGVTWQIRGHGAMPPFRGRGNTSIRGACFLPPPQPHNWLWACFYTTILRHKSTFSDTVGLSSFWCLKRAASLLRRRCTHACIRKQLAGW